MRVCPTKSTLNVCGNLVSALSFYVSTRSRWQDSQLLFRCEDEELFGAILCHGSFFATVANRADPWTFAEGGSSGIGSTKLSAKDMDFGEMFLLTARGSYLVLRTLDLFAIMKYALHAIQVHGKENVLNGPENSLVELVVPIPSYIALRETVMDVHSLHDLIKDCHSSISSGGSKTTYIENGIRLGPAAAKKFCFKPDEFGPSRKWGTVVYPVYERFYVKPYFSGYRLLKDSPAY